VPRDFKSLKKTGPQFYNCEAIGPKSCVDWVRFYGLQGLGVLVESITRELTGFYEVQYGPIDG
jgi:hypothetical protein